MISKLDVNAPVFKPVNNPVNIDMEDQKSGETTTKKKKKQNKKKKVEEDAQADAAESKQPKGPPHQKVYRVKAPETQQTKGDEQSKSNESQGKEEKKVKEEIPKAKKVDQPKKAE